MNWIRREPVRAFTAASILASWIIAGLTVFDLWHPSEDQLLWATTSVATIAGAFGFTVVRQAVTPNDTVVEQVADAHNKGVIAGVLSAEKQATVVTSPAPVTVIQADAPESAGPVPPA